MRAGGSNGREWSANPVSEFAEELRRLRAGAGNPSFRQMAGVSRSISHTTLHEAATGSRFPSWETTREFVRACGADEAEWRARWEHAKQAAAGRPGPVPGGPPAPGGRGPGTRRGRPPRPLVLVVAGIAGGGAAAVAIITMWPAEPSPKAQSSLPTGPMIPGDRSRFITDVTIPDGTKVKVNETFEKVWEIQNAGTIFWRNRFLQRLDVPVSSTSCRTVARIPVGDTLPNDRVKISVTVTAPRTPGTCMVKWKMVDAQGRQLFPTSRPVYFLVHVVKAAGASPEE
jgi:hypothetical protein